MDNKEKAVRLYEINELSNENSKTYAMSDGSMQTVFTVDGNDTVNEGIMTLAATEAEPSASMITKSWRNSVFSDSAEHAVGITGTAENLKANRMYLAIDIPTLPRNPRIKNAELVLKQKSYTVSNKPAIGLYRIDGELTSGTVNTFPLDYEIKKNSADAEYRFDITNLTDEAYRTGVTRINLAVKLIKEDITTVTNTVIYGASNNVNKPEIRITYESSYGSSSYYRTHDHNLGKFGTASVDLACGNLTFESTDFAWSGNRMPVTIKRTYNSALYDKQYKPDDSVGLIIADFSAMKLGYGWRLNLMQSMVSAVIYHDGALHDGYIYTDENGCETRFIPEKDENGNETGNFVSVDDNEIKYDKNTATITMGDTYYTFTNGRLAEIKQLIKKDEDGNDLFNTNAITYTDNRITKVTDGAGREFEFTYNSAGYLICIKAPDGSEVKYGYTGDGRLSSVMYPDNSVGQMTYNSVGKPRQVILLDSKNQKVFRTTYNYIGDRLLNFTEHGVEDGVYVAGKTTSFDYSAASGRTVVTVSEPPDASEGKTANTVTKTVYTFDDEGSVISEYTYSDGLESTGISGDNTESSIPYTDNLLRNHRFVNTELWSPMANNLEGFYMGSYSDLKHKYGRYACVIGSYTDTAVANGIYQTTDTLTAGEYTFSGYVYFNTETSLAGADPGVYLQVTDTNGNILCESEHINDTSDGYVRLIAPFTLTENKAVEVRALVDGKCVVFFNAPQLEKNGFATSYNMLCNSGFEKGTEAWELSSGAVTTAAESFNGGRSLKLTGDIDKQVYAYQSIKVKPKRGTRETYTLSGWAKAVGALPERDRDGVTNSPRFRLRATVKYTDDTEDEYHYADFSPCTDEWQYVSMQFSKESYSAVDEIRISCDYLYNTGEAYFDNIQLVCDSVEYDVDIGEFYLGLYEDEEYEDSKIITKDDIATGFEELTDDFGNTITNTTFTDGEFGTVYRSSTYDSDGNNIVIETDARGNLTKYTVDSDTSRNTEVTDRCGNKTAYEYDETGKTTKVTSKDAFDTELANVSYSYDAFDNMTEIVRGDGMKYILGYNSFHELETIGVDGSDTSLIRYDYKNGNGRLKSVTYANGDSMKATYNALGQMIAETWYGTDENDNTVLTAKYKYVYDNNGNIVRTIDILSLKEYNYIYEDNRLTKATEYNITLGSNELVTAKTVKNTVFYIYDTDGNMTRKVVQPAYGDIQTVYYEHPENGNTVVKFSVPRNGGGVAHTVTSHSGTDSFGRKVFDELQHGLGVTSRHFTYYNGEVTEEHAEAEKYKSAPTTHLIKEIVISSSNQWEEDRILGYEYDNEERITKVTDSLEGVTEYTYDALGQLLTETVNGTAVNIMTYDNYGNILTKNGKAYTYDGIWKDKLISYDGQTVTYDAQGNPTSYLGHSLTWEKGRQLKSYDDITYTYNANGIRTSKTIDGVKHIYTLEGTKILREEWDKHTLIPLYDNEDNVCGIRYDQFTYFFVKNLQGDVIAITDLAGRVRVRYTYDAWGKCVTVYDDTTEKTGSINPFRYRGYYYDRETGLYYLQSRYYDPNVGRFVNGDDVNTITLIKSSFFSNIFSYCSNNVINDTDSNGKLGISTLLSVIDDALSIITSIAEMAVINTNSFKDIGKKIKSAKRNDRKKLIDEQRKLIKKGTGRKLFYIAKVVNFIAIFAPYVENLSSWGSERISFIRFIVEIIIQAISDIFCKALDLLLKLIPYVGVIIGFAGSWLLGKLLALHFTSSRISRIATYFNKQYSNLTTFKRWINSFCYALTL